MNFISRLLKRFRTGGYRRKIRTEGTTEVFGNPGAAWGIRTDLLSANSSIYSFGVGEDISFDLEVIRRLNATVEAFDPTPRAQKYVTSLSLPRGFHFHPIGIADYDGQATFFPPRCVTHVSHSMVYQPDSSGQSFQAPVKTLPTILRELGHSHIDVLKLDIEGMEYGVLNSLREGGIFPTQILVEFHERFVGGRKATHNAICSLQRAGYNIFWISDSGDEFGFCRAAGVRPSELVN